MTDERNPNPGDPSEEGVTIQQGEEPGGASEEGVTVPEEGDEPKGDEPPKKDGLVMEF